MIELRGRGQKLQPTVYVGKEGITSSVLEEISRQLKKSKLIKVRLLPSLESDRKMAGEHLASESHAVLVEVRGRTVLLAKDEA